VLSKAVLDLEAVQLHWHCPSSYYTGWESSLTSTGVTLHQQICIGCGNLSRYCYSLLCHGTWIHELRLFASNCTENTELLYSNGKQRIITQ